MNSFLKFIRPGIFPLTICLFYIIFLLVYKLVGLPEPRELVLIIKEWFEIYGFWLLAVAAFLEGLFVIGVYFPGSLAIVLAVYTFGNSTKQLFMIGVISFIAFLVANVLNYLLGRVGYYRFLLAIGQKDTVERMNKAMQKHAAKTFFSTGFFPNFFAVTSVCAGIAKMRFERVFVLQAASLFLWVTLWTILGSMIAKKIGIEDKNQSVYIIALFVGWAAFLMIKEYIISRREIK